MIPLKNLNALRFISMIAIVFAHSSMMFNGHFFDDKHVFIGGPGNFWFYSFLINFSKFATIVFFIISGYLFQTNQPKYTSFKKFIGNKYKKLLVPYIIIFFIPIVIMNLPFSPFSEGIEPITFQGFCFSILKKIFLSNYWFIPVIFVYFIINFFLPYHHLKIAFPISVIITVFYAFNLYHPIIPTSHTLSILGFCSFFFIGRIASRINTNSNYFSIALLFFLLALMFSLYESWILYYKFSQEDAWNTLKFSNIVYAFAVLFLLKDKIAMPKKLLQTDTYFIYLFHPHLKRLFVSFCNLLERKGFLVPQSNVLTLVKIFVFILICYGAERVYTNAKNNSLKFNFNKPSFLLKNKSYNET